MEELEKKSSPEQHYVESYWSASISSCYSRVNKYSRSANGQIYFAKLKSFLTLDGKVIWAMGATHMQC